MKLQHMLVSAEYQDQQNKYSASRLQLTLINTPGVFELGSQMTSTKMSVSVSGTAINHSLETDKRKQKDLPWKRR